MPVVNDKSVDPDQTQRSVASDLGLHYSQCPFYGTLGINGLNCWLNDKQYDLGLLCLLIHV